MTGGLDVRGVGVTVCRYVQSVKDTADSSVGRARETPDERENLRRGPEGRRESTHAHQRISVETISQNVAEGRG
jgi:hypothetical protein